VRLRLGLLLFILNELNVVAVIFVGR